MAELEEEEERVVDVEIYGDVLETIFSYVPLVDLVSASHVSKSWCQSVTSSLRHHRKPKPWLILHTQATRHPYATTTHAYDPRSHVWIKIPKASIKHGTSALKSSQSNFLYMLSPSKFSFTVDPFNVTWCHVEPPLVWRTDPIVARVGDSVIIAGGACDFEDHRLAVEIYDLKTRAWCTCESMPRDLKNSAASQWISIATTTEKLIVTDKQSGFTHWFDPETKSWSEERLVLNPSQPVLNFNIGSSNENLILVGLCRIENVERVKIWRICSEDFLQYEEIGEMPLEHVEKLRNESFGISSINIRVAANIVYIYNPWEVEELVACELISGGGCSWWSVQNIVARDAIVIDRFVITCSEVGIDELRRVTSVEK